MNLTILSAGYIPGAEALAVMAEFAAYLREKNPDLLFVLDREFSLDLPVFLVDI